MSAWKKYMENEVMTSNPARVTIRAYEKCILELQLIKVRISEFKYRESEEKIILLERIINELSMQLNEQAYPDLAADLYRLYDWALGELKVIAMTKEAERCDPLIGVFKNLLEGYQGALDRDA